jgi:uncharacterized protein (DUF305 family)
MKSLSQVHPGTLATLALLASIAVAQFRSGEGHAEDPFQKAMMDSMSRMDRDMRNAPMTGDPDHDFAAMMIPHHQGAIDMAKAELLYGKNPVLRRLAQEIITTQNSEIQVMRRQLSKPDQPDSARHSGH